MHVSSALVKGPSIKHYEIYYVITGHVCGSFLFVSKICVNATVKVNSKCYTPKRVVDGMALKACALKLCLEA